jgi:hypothetical protein
MTSLSNIVRAKSDPRVLKQGPSSASWADRLGRNLGWFSIGLGVVELCAPRTLTRALGLQGMEPMVRAFGAREIVSGVVCLSVEKKTGLWTRVAGDVVDIATLMPGLNRWNPKRGNVKLAMAAVIGVTIADLYAAKTLSTRQRRTRRSQSYKDRTGFPHGLANARNASRRPPTGESNSPAADVHMTSK